MNRLMKSDRDALVNAARSTILKHATGTTTHAEKISTFWSDVHAGAFATAYRALPPTSENVWCCMSNGNYDRPQAALQNIVDSANVCATRDSRVDPAIVPVAFEVCLFAPRHLWLLLGNGREAIHKMERELQRALMVVGNNGASAVYLPDVWNQYRHWSAAQLLENLSAKAGAASVMEVYEIPCYVAADTSIAVEIHDRGFFASLILERAWQFYEAYRDGNRLAYLVDGAKVVQYQNDGATVRSYGDVAAYCALARLLKKQCNKVLQYALHEFTQDDVASLAARVSLLIDVAQPLDLTAIENLASGGGGGGDKDFAFVQPQAVIALVNAYNLLHTGRAQWELRQQIATTVTEYLNSVGAISDAFDKHGAFAANWYLQAISAVDAARWSCLTCADLRNSLEKNKAALLRHAVVMCYEALEAQNSITEEACAAHGLIASRRFDFIQWDEMTERWARRQHEWNARGGFRYRVDEPWYRTDVTSHVVQVCLLLRARGR